MKRSAGKKIQAARTHMDAAANKSVLARQLGIARSSLYYQSILEEKDERAKQQIQTALDQHPHYGHKRIALELNWNKKRALRIMNKFDLHPKRRKKKPYKKEDQGNESSKVENIAKTLCPIQPNALWVGDFTYLPWKGDFIYLATVLDVFTREVIGWHIGMNHTTSLVIEAFLDGAARTNSKPRIFHSDQGSEYISGAHEKLLETLNIIPSHSKKSSPWENGYQESFYSNFKFELGSTKQFNDLGQLCEAIHQQMNYYNTDRIHTSIKTQPATFRQQYEVRRGKCFSNTKTTVIMAASKLSTNLSNVELQSV